MSGWLRIYVSKVSGNRIINEARHISSPLLGPGFTFGPRPTRNQDAGNKKSIKAKRIKPKEEKRKRKKTPREKKNMKKKKRSRFVCKYSCTP